MNSLYPEGAKLTDFRFPPGKAGTFLQRVQSKMAKVVLDHGGDVVVRMEIAGTGAAPIYRIEKPSGKHLMVINGVGHKQLADDAASESSRRWSNATMSVDEVSNASLSCLSDELRALQAFGQ